MIPFNFWTCWTLKNKDGGLAKAIPLLLCGGWSKAFVWPWFGRSNAAEKKQPQVPGVASLVVSAAQAKATCPRPKCKPMPPKYYVLSQKMS